MQNQVFHLGSERTPGSSLTGQKAAALNALLRNGFPAPPGVCISTHAFRAALQPLQARLVARLANSELPNDPATAHETARKVQTLLQDLQLPPGLQQELDQALAELERSWLASEPKGSVRWAVRSSATLEDRPDFSAAGQYRSVLGVTGRGELEKAILACWQSFYSAHALAARANRGPEEAAGMAVLIQPLIAAECAGVCFTVDPVRRRPDLLLIQAAWGLGAGVAEGSVPADRYGVRRFDLGSEETWIADKTVCIQPASQGGVEQVGVPEPLRRIPCLPESWIERVAQFGLAAEQALGQPQDVEWAIAREQVWILQSRPITALPGGIAEVVHFPVEWANEEEPRHFWFLEPINQRAGDVLLPAEIAFVLHRTLGGGAAVEYAGMAKTRWRKIIHGRVYITVADSTLSPGECRVRGAAFKDLHERLQLQEITLWEHWGPEIEAATRRLDAFEGHSADGPALANHLEDALAAAQRHWMIHTLIPRQGRFARLNEAYGQLTGKRAEDIDQELNFLLQGTETVQTRLVEALYDLACLGLQTQAGTGNAAQTVAHLREVIMAPDAGQVTDAGTARFLQRFNELMVEYGGRICLRRSSDSPVELPLPWRAVPEHVLEMIALYLPLARQPGALGPREARERASLAVQRRVEALCAASPEPGQAAEFRRRLEFARRNAAFTDEHNHYIDQLAEGQYAQAMLYAGIWLAARNLLRQPYDVFWLEPEEVLPALRGGEKPDFAPLIIARQALFNAQGRLYPPATIGVPDPHLPERPATTVASAPEPAPAGGENLPNSDENMLAGQPASPGLGTGRARVVTAPVPLPEIAPGDVLIAANAGPEWTPVFPILAAIVLDGGSPGQHAAITAREFGIPAVFATAHATGRIPQGARVTVDGERGTVRWD